MNRNRPYPHFKFPDEISIEYFPLDESGCKWHNVKLNSYEIRCTNYGWFPTGVLMGTINGKYADTNNIGANIGGNLGTAGIAVVNIQAAIALLNAAGYNNISESITVF